MMIIFIHTFKNLCKCIFLSSQHVSILSSDLSIKNQYNYQYNFIKKYIWPHVGSTSDSSSEVVSGVKKYWNTFKKNKIFWKT